MNEMQASEANTIRIFPVPMAILVDTIKMHAEFDEGVLLGIKDANLYDKTVPNDPTKWLLELNARPDLKNDEHKRRAYRIGVDFGAAVVRKVIAERKQDYQSDEFQLPSTLSDEMFSRQGARPSISSYIAADGTTEKADIEELLKNNLEKVWTRGHVSFIEPQTDNAAEDLFISGCRDIFALYALLHHESPNRRAAVTLASPH